VPTKEDREDASDARAGAGRPREAHRAGEAELPEGRGAEDARRPQVATRPESFSARVFDARWSIVAGLCLLVAAALLPAGRMDAAFVVATLGVVAWFWNERNRLRPQGIETDERYRDEDEEFEDRDEE
jgi:hypothetical protein